MASARKGVHNGHPTHTETADTKGNARADNRHHRRRHYLRPRDGSEIGVAARKLRHPVKTTSLRVPRRRLPAPPKLLLLLLVACALRHRDQQNQGSGGFTLGWGANAELRPETDLTSNCLNFPARNFDPESSIEAVNGGNSPYLPMSTGEDAIDFTLHDLDGNAWNLRETLERTGLPVVMVWGMYTCPAFQGYGDTPPWDEGGYWNERSLVREGGRKWLRLPAWVNHV